MLYCIMGQSAVGKDTVYSKVLDSRCLDIKPLITYTTRPIRQGEVDGEQYHFISLKQLNDTIDDFIEVRSYKVYDNNTWYYGTKREDLELCMGEDDYITVCSPKQFSHYVSILKYNIIPIFIYCNQTTRMIRSMKRIKNPNDTFAINEAIRRFTSDDDYKLPYHFDVNLINFSISNEDATVEEVSNDIVDAICFYRDANIFKLHRDSIKREDLRYNWMRYYSILIGLD